MRNKIIGAASALLTLIALLGCSQLFVAGQESEKRSGRIEGVWRTVVTVRNCATGAPLPVPPFPGILMFNEGGTMSGTSTAAASVYGTWVREHGSYDYSFTTLSFKYDAAGVLIGSRNITQTVRLDDNGIPMTTSGGFQDFDLNGNPTVSGCSTATGMRFGS